jgi:hypothetical protein
MTDARKSRLYLALIAALLLVIAAMAWKFIIAGSTEKAVDGRVAVLVTSQERAAVLAEMRDFVAGLQAISDALAREDMRGVAAAARAMGTARTRGEPAALMAKLPLEFKRLGLGVHADFDTIALDAERLAQPRHSLGQLAAALQKCVACHASYQIKATDRQN